MGQDQAFAGSIGVFSIFDFFQHVLHFFPDPFWLWYSYCIAQTENPTEKLLADGNGNSNLEMTVINLDRNNIMTKAIKSADWVEAPSNCAKS